MCFPYSKNRVISDCSLSSDQQLLDEKFSGESSEGLGGKGGREILLTSALGFMHSQGMFVELESGFLTSNDAKQVQWAILATSITAKE